METGNLLASKLVRETGNLLTSKLGKETGNLLTSKLVLYRAGSPC